MEEVNPIEFGRAKELAREVAFDRLEMLCFRRGVFNTIPSNEYIIKIGKSGDEGSEEYKIVVGIIYKNGKGEERYEIKRSGLVTLEVNNSGAPLATGLRRPKGSGLQHPKDEDILTEEECGDPQITVATKVADFVEKIAEVLPSTG